MIFSYSSLATFKQCPAKFKFAYIDRIEAPALAPSPALERGSKVHDSVEDFMLGRNEYLHPDIHENYGQFMFSIREEGGDIRPEWKWGITWDFRPCAYDAQDCMFHGFVDLLVIPPEDQYIPLYEWKTGKVYMEPHVDQISKYSLAVMTHFPEHPGVDAMVTWFDQVDFKKVTYVRDMELDYRFFLRKEINNVVDTKQFPEMPSFKCKWCKFSRFNGGPCETG